MAKKIQVQRLGNFKIEDVLPHIVPENTKSKDPGYTRIYKVEDSIEGKLLATHIWEVLKPGIKDGFGVKMTSQRYHMFNNQGLTCVCCGKTALYFGLDHPFKVSRPHFNLYGKDDQGKELLFTKDHKFPKVYGGFNIQDNYQVMCADCNNAKSKEIPNYFFYNWTREKKQTVIYVYDSNLVLHGKITNEHLPYITPKHLSIMCNTMLTEATEEELRTYIEITTK